MESLVGGVVRFLAGGAAGSSVASGCLLGDKFECRCAVSVSDEVRGGSAATLHKARALDPLVCSEGGCWGSACGGALQGPALLECCVLEVNPLVHEFARSPQGDDCWLVLQDGSELLW
jgi:hypothetical protein